MTPTIDQDIQYLNAMQSGLHSRGFTEVLLNKDEERIQHFQENYWHAWPTWNPSQVRIYLLK